jgi:hypothetical protein
VVVPAWPIDGPVANDEVVPPWSIWKMFEWVIPHQNRVPSEVGSLVVKVPVAGVLNPHEKVVTGAGGAGVGAALVDPQMVNPELVTLPSEYQMTGVPAVTAKLLIWASVCSRVVEVPIVK